MNSDPAGRTSPRRIKRNHASAWILLAAVGATGGALAVAAMHDPQGMRQHLDATLAEVKSMTGASSSTDTTITAQAEATAITPEPTPVQEPAPAAEAKAIVPGQSRSSDAPLMPVAPAAGQGASDTSKASRVKQLAPPATDMTKELAETQQVVPNPLPPALLPHLPPPPAVEAPPTVVAPPAVQPSDEVAPPPVQAPASSPQP